MKFSSESKEVTPFFNLLLDLLYFPIILGMTKPLITAVIPTYKRPHYLQRAVRTVLAQTYPHFQVLIADNASGPETDAVIQNFQKQDARVHHLKHPKNLGMCGNFQAALMEVKTPYVCFLPDDDAYAPHFFEECLKPFDLHPDIAFSGGGRVLFFNEEYEVSSHVEHILKTMPPSGYYPPAKAAVSHLRALSGIQFPAILFKTDMARQVGGFDSRLAFSIDADLMLKCAARYPVYILSDRPVYFYFQHNGSLTHSFDLNHQEKESLYLCENITAAPLPHQEREEIEQWFRNWRLRIFSKQYGHHYQQKSFDQACHYAEQIYALTNSPQWKNRQKRAALYARFPALAMLYEGMKTLERFFRTGTQTTPPQQQVSFQSHPESNYWKEYLKKLRGED